jgi:phosphoribosylaminoimidazole-succinocarboxamide synthase
LHLARFGIIEALYHFTMNLSDTELIEAIVDAVTVTDLLGYTKLHTGKVRDIYEHGDNNILISTDRHSSFDRQLPPIPFKGQVLNSLSAFWFRELKDIFPNHLIATPDPAVAVVKKATVFPVEFVVRGYMTGSTDTSIWQNYQNGVRDYCGHKLPEGLQKNEPLPENIVTPTTKPYVGHDELITPAEIIQCELMTKQQWDKVKDASLRLFKAGQQHAAKQGLILADTKFEFGIEKNTGEILLIDEILTADSSRYWKTDSYEQRLKNGEEPESFDKEFLRLWYRDNCDPYSEAELPPLPNQIRVRMAQLYFEAYEAITGEKLEPQLGGAARIQKNLDEYFANK